MKTSLKSPAVPTEGPGPGFRLFTSNRLERLAEQLAGVVAEPSSSLFRPEVIAVQSRGMARWVSLQIAEINGVCMNCEFPFPRSFVDRILRAFFPSMSPEEEFSREVLTWKIYRELPALLSRDEFAAVRNYLNPYEALRSFELAGRIAHLFDQYLVYRPDMLRRWENDETHWQAELWRKVGGGQPHLAAVAESLEERMIAEPVGSELPARVSIFGISSLPPLYLRAFFGLARHCQVNLFSLAPSQEYYGHDLSPKAAARALKKAADAGGPLPSPSEGNPLLTALGKLGRDFVEVRLELDERAGFLVAEQPETFLAPPDGSMLQLVQTDILRAQSRGSVECPRRKVTPADRSIQIHSCHSPLREVEVLYDHLLELIEEDMTLRPRDILVMSPDIEKYAPLVTAVFGCPESERRRIPFSVADRLPRRDSPVIGTFMALLELPGSRCTASEIFLLLDRAPVRRRFGFSDEDMLLIRQWINETGIRWGIDGAHREALGLPLLEGNTWRAGFERLLLGFAMPGGNRTTFEGIMPFDEVEGGGADVLGRLVTAVEGLFDIVNTLDAARPPAEWAMALGKLLEHFLCAGSPEEAADVRVIRSALQTARRHAELGGCQDKVEFPVIRRHLTDLLDGGAQRGGFLTGGVTFCALQPMRSIPARVICLIGMNDQVFPRPDRAAPFDLMVREPRLGDRSLREDDRTIFLEVLISARERLFCSYVGQSQIDNESIPPSVLLSELLDYLDQAFTFPGEGTARSFALTEHRLHAFSPRYFQNERRLFSYSETNAAAARKLPAGGRRSRADFLARALPPPEDAPVSLRNLIDFFANPAKYFVRHRLGLWLDERDDELNDSEAFELCALDRYRVEQDLLECALAGETIGPPEFAARGLLPHGAMAAAGYGPLEKGVAGFLQTVRAELPKDCSPGPVPVDIRLGQFSLTGEVEGVWGDTLIHYRCATIKIRDRLRAWVSHLALCAAQSAFAKTRLIGTDATVRFGAIKDPGALLEGLLRRYWEGLSRPLPFFPESALEYVQQAGKGSASALNKARWKWNGSEYGGPGERKKSADAPYYLLCFGERDPLDEEFEDLAREVFAPMLANEGP